LREQIPLQGEVWDEKRPGFLEADSVAHCGSSLAGNFVWSLTYTDLASAWTEGRAVYNRGAQGVLEQTRHVDFGLLSPRQALVSCRRGKLWSPVAEATY